MSWTEHHSRSENLAAEAEMASRTGDATRAEQLYRQAAEAEEAAFDNLTSAKLRTRGITCVSAVALWYKSHEYATAERTALTYLTISDLPSFAKVQLRELLHLIWTADVAQQSGVNFIRGDVLVSVKGGEVIYGGAPLDLIMRKVEGVQAIVSRAVEMLLQRPFRKRGQPEPDIQSVFRPWLFQAPAGSYQFAVRVQEPKQMSLWESDRPKVERVTATIFDILRASASDPENELRSVVDDDQYRLAFLSLSRNLAPTGKSFDLLEVRDASAPTSPVASFGMETRQEINAALRRAKPPRSVSTMDEPVTLHGVLRGVHLDEDWIELSTETPPSHVRVEEAGDALETM